MSKAQDASAGEHHAHAASRGQSMDAGPLALTWLELRRHAPYTAIGAVTGVLLMVFIAIVRVPRGPLVAVFNVLHPIHVLFSALVTASLYRLYKRNLVVNVIVGYLGAVVIGTLSDIILPHLGGLLLGASMEHIHIGFIEHWYVVNPLALLGVAIALWRPTTKFPHSGHMLLSTWASLFYLTGYGHGGHGQETYWLPLLPAAFVVLFLAVWLPCCLSDIVFPMLFVRRNGAREQAHGH